MYDDFQRNRILNQAILIGLALGLAQAVYQQGIHGILFSLSGIFIPFLLLVVFYLFHMIGAGDIKFLMMLGGCVGAEQVTGLMFAAFAIGAVAALMKMLVHRTFYIRFQFLWNYILRTVRSRQIEPYYRKEELAAQDRIHFAIPIGLAYFLWIGGLMI